MPKPVQERRAVLLTDIPLPPTGAQPMQKNTHACNRGVSWVTLVQDMGASARLMG